MVKKFIIESDHRPLVWLMSLKEPSSKLLRWRIKLDEYNFEIKYKARKLNSNAEALSRIRPPFEIINTNDKGQNIVHCISNDKVLKNGLQKKLTRDLIAENF